MDLDLSVFDVFEESTQPNVDVERNQTRLFVDVFMSM